MTPTVRSALFVAFLLVLLFGRQVATHYEIQHFQPYLALCFALAALKPARWLALPFLGYLLSTLFTQGNLGIWALPTLLSFALIALLGRQFRQIRRTSLLLAGSLAGAAVFYLVTNFASWLASPGYAKSWTGLAQALWTGHPGYPPTWSFFRNDALSTLLFTALILVANRLAFPKSLAAEGELTPVAAR
ncbi:DUF6580 family putative transport protein [Roseibacillus ishigakijimensis]|uniref:Uncharacterized protein n=1 Tax=Roseibacillus ishigakijimensis TaxID=454146 RepID=A0A934RJ05_9BACT|nr:DUF6580 family putative transport protein [Roseibacillus ishigakijimensis]MBK1832522.1 hypothetical protein [Roseibacillus ishigakijimensis]